MSACSACLYRLGGRAKDGSWYDFLSNTKARDIGCSLIVLGYLYLSGVRAEGWQWLISFGFSWLALTTYHKWLNPLFGHTKHKVYWYGWFAHGLGCGLALSFLPIPFRSIVLRTVITGLLMSGWSEVFADPTWEEAGRGFFLAITLPILM